MGVFPGLPVKIGTADTSSAILAAGMRIGDLLHVVGTTQVLAGITEHPEPDPKHLTRQLGVGEAFLHVIHNPVGGVALGWLKDLCFREQTDQEFYVKTIPSVKERQTTVTLDPPFLGGDRLEIEAHQAAFRELTLTTDRLDLLVALLEAMRRGNRQAVSDLALGDKFERIFLTGGGAEVVQDLIPEYAGQNLHLLQEGSLLGIARLFQ